MKLKLMKFMLASTLKKILKEENPNESVKLKKTAEDLRWSIIKKGYQAETDEQFDSINPNQEKINYNGRHN
tara:strand:- start:10463 stop:10675 length:213 start_codon:yes stop_codon:yes gene_type:complete